MNDFLDGVKQELQEVTNQIDIRTLSRVDEYFTKLEQDLKMQKKLLQEKIQKEMYKDFEIENKIPKHALIDVSVPYIQFKKGYNSTRKVDNFYFGKAEEDVNGCFKWKSEIEIFQQELVKYNKFLFKINQNLPKEEFVIYIKFKCYPNWFYNKNGNNDIYGETIDITYITNYGRFANIFENLHALNIIGQNQYGIKDKLCDMLKSEDIQPLTYKMPAIFTKIIDAIYNENTSLMQECCSEYLTRYIENKKLKEENAKLKNKIELLKLQMEEQRKHFMG